MARVTGVVIQGDADPRTNAGTEAPVGALYINTVTTERWVKASDDARAWRPIEPTTSVPARVVDLARYCNLKVHGWDDIEDSAVITGEGVDYLGTHAEVIAFLTAWQQRRIVAGKLPIRCPGCGASDEYVFWADDGGWEEAAEARGYGRPIELWKLGIDDD